MAPATTGKRSAPSSDFKRIKAKVGKKAPKPANYTDTSFQKASLHVSTQQQKQQATSGVRSSRGRSLTTLSQQLGHTTTSIRQSAAKGLLDIVSHRQDQSWLDHLSTVLPALGHCLLDTESTVRATGLAVWQQVADQATENALRPFWSVFIAFLSSALNALDRRVRRDSRIVVELASRQFPSLVAPHAPKLLPALMRLTDDPAFQYHHQVSSSTTTTSTTTSSSSSTTDSCVKRNRNGRQVWLDTLTAVLRTIRHDKDERDKNTLDTTSFPNQWIFTQGNTSKNSLFLARPQVSQVRLLPMRKWWLDSSGLGETQQMVTLSQGSHGALSETVANDVWTKLRDLCLEILESNNSEETLSIWAVAVLALLDAAGDPTLPESERLVTQIQGLVASHDAATLSLKGLWMLALARLSQALPESTTDHSRKSAWVPRVVNFLLENEESGSSNEKSNAEKSIHWQLLGHILDDPVALKTKAGRKIVDHMVHNWDEGNLSLVPRLYAVAPSKDRQSLLQQMVDFCVETGSSGNEETVAWVYEFILDNIRDPRAVPGDLIARFQPVWDKDVVAQYRIESTQRLAVSLLVNLLRGQTVPSNILTALARLCAGSVGAKKPCISSSVAAFIQDSVFDMRRSMSLSGFFTFLMDGTGVTSASTKYAVDDMALQNTASYLLGSGVPNHKISKMLWPLWRSWLGAKSVAPKRAAVSFLTVLSIDNASQRFLHDNLPSSDHKALLRAIISILQDQERSSSSVTWFQPVVSLLRHEDWLWEPLLQTAAENLAAIETVFLYNCRDILREVVQATLEAKPLLEVLQRSAEKLEEAAQDGPLRAATRELCDCVKAIVAALPSAPEET